MEDYLKYIKYKYKYLKEKHKLEQNGGGKLPFYFMHMTTKFDNIISILKDGVIRLGTDNIESEGYSGEDKHSYVYGFVYFEDLHNLTHMRDFSFIIKPTIIYEQKVIFNKGWQTNITSNSIIMSDNTINQIKDYLANPTEIPQKVIDASSFYHHEVLFTEHIKLDNILAIVCNGCSKKMVKKINKIIKKMNYDIKIITKNYPFPSF